MSINLSVPPTTELKPRIVVIGVGGAGGNAVNNMIASQLEGVEFLVANTDAQALANSRCDRRLQLGVNITQGLGAGSRPDVGRAAAEEAIETIVQEFHGCHMAFITAGMGGGTGTGGAPVIARAARDMGILTVGVVTKPFQFEGTHRMTMAEAGIEELQKVVDTLIIIPNQNLFRIANEKTTFADAFNMADDVLHSGVRGVTDLMVMPGLINLDFADVKTVMSEMGKAMMGTGEAEGEKRAIEAAEAAISNPLLDDVSMKGARGVLINITGGMDLTLFEVDEAANRIRNEVDPDANIIVGSTFEESLAGSMRVSVVATGIDVEEAIQPKPLSLVTSGLTTRPESLGTSEDDGGSMPDVATRPYLDVVSAGVPTSANTAQAEQAPVAQAFESEEHVMAEAPKKAVGAENMGFVAPQPMEPRAHRAPILASEPVVQPAAQPAPQPTVQANPEADTGSKKRYRSVSLFERVTGGAWSRQEKEEEVQPVENKQSFVSQPVQPQADRVEPTLTSTGMEEASVPVNPEKVEDDLLDIPAFLRRQAN